MRLSATAARMRSFKAASSIFSPSWMSMARLVFPSRLELNRPDGSSRAAPLAKVILTTLLYVSPVQTRPPWDQTGVPIHFHSSTISGSASWMSLRTFARVFPRQSPSCSILASIRREAESAETGFFMFSSRARTGSRPGAVRCSLESMDSCAGTAPAAPLVQVRQSEQVHAGELEQGEREQRHVAHPDDRLLLCHGDEGDDDRQREGHGQPAVEPPDPAAPAHRDLLRLTLAHRPPSQPGIAAACFTHFAICASSRSSAWMSIQRCSLPEPPGGTGRSDEPLKKPTLT